MRSIRHMNRIHDFAIVGLIALAAWVSFFSPAQAEPSWTSLGSADFPARVNAIVFPSGNRIDSSSGVCWGKWCANFGPERPEAHLTNIINVWPLECENPVVGLKECYITLVMEEPRTCNLHILKEEELLKLISISCPQELRLE
ncbi:MAG: hypothetical protein V3V96_13130 [Acidiferrobacterales bacterium]